MPSAKEEASKKNGEQQGTAQTGGNKATDGAPLVLPKVETSTLSKRNDITTGRPDAASPKSFATALKRKDVTIAPAGMSIEESSSFSLASLFCASEPFGTVAFIKKLGEKTAALFCYGDKAEYADGPGGAFNAQFRAMPPAKVALAAVAFEVYRNSFVLLVSKATVSPGGTVAWVQAQTDLEAAADYDSDGSGKTFLLKKAGIEVTFNPSPSDKVSVKLADGSGFQLDLKEFAP